MKCRDARKNVLQNLSEALGPMGFKAKKTRGVLMRPCAIGHQIISPVDYDYEPKVIIGFFTGIQVPEVEQWLDRVSPCDPVEARYKSTVRCAVSDLSADIKYEYSVFSDADVDRVMGEVVSAIKRDVLPALDRLSSLEALDHAMNTPTREGELFWKKLGDLYGGMVAITLARLQGRSDLEELVSTYGARLAKWRDDIKAPYFQLAELLLNEPKG